MRKKLAILLMSAVLAGALPCTGLYAEETPASEEVQEADAGETEAMTETDVSVSVPENRPEYQALDYVKIDDEEYKKLQISVYPPADSSDEAASEYQKTVDTLIMTQLFSLYPVREIPEDLMNYTVGSLTETYQEYARMYGMDFASFLQTYLQQDETTFNAQVKKAAEQTLKEELLLKAVAEKEGITISDEEYAQGVADYAVRYGYESSDALSQAFDEPTIRISLLMDKTFEYLESVTKIDLIIETETESETENGAMTEAETSS
jgi:FKBP-type peptidyl-prolyl cis-trans isomerase (trigger factor)